MESVRGVTQGCGRAHAAHAGNGAPLRSAQPVSRRREHPWRRGVSGLAEAQIQRRPSLDDGGVLRGRRSDFPPRTRLFLARCPGIRSTRLAALSGKTNSEQRWGKADARLEVTDEKRLSFGLVVASRGAANCKFPG